MVGSVQEEFLPEAFGELDVLIFFLRYRSARVAVGDAGGAQERTHAKEGFVETYNLGLECLRPRDLGERRGLHRVEV